MSLKNQCTCSIGILPRQIHGWPGMPQKQNNIISDLETYLADYATLAEERYRLPLALWIVGTFIYPRHTATPRVKYENLATRARIHDAFWEIAKIVNGIDTGASDTTDDEIFLACLSIRLRANEIIAATFKKMEDAE